MKRVALRSDPVKVREWQDRSRHAIPRKARLAPVTRDRAKKDRDFERAYHSPEYVAAVKRLECYVPGCYRRPVDPAHGEHSKGATGTWRWILPLCAGLDGHHREQHSLGRRTFEAKYGISLEVGALETRKLLAHITGESFEEPEAAEAVLDVPPVVGPEVRF